MANGPTPEQRAILGGFDQPTDETAQTDGDEDVPASTGEPPASELDTTPAPSGGDTNDDGGLDAGGFGEELGGDPVGSAGGTGGDSSGDEPAPTSPPEPSDVQNTPSGGGRPADAGGIEDMTSTTGELVLTEGGVTTERDLARDLEADFLAENPGLTAEDVRVVREGNQFLIESRGGDPIGRGPTFPGDAAADFGGRGRGQLETAGGRGVTDIDAQAFGGAGRGVSQQIEGQLEEQVGRMRARSLGISPSLLGAEGARQLADLERGEDFTTDVRGTRGQMTVEAGLSPGFVDELQREFATRAFEAETGVALEREDIAVTDEGARLTRSGEVAVRADAPEQFGDVRIGIGGLPSGIDVRTEPAAVGVGGPGPRRTRRGERVTGFDLERFEPGTTLEEGLAAGAVAYSDLAEQVTQANLEYNPFASTTVEAAELFGAGEEAEAAIRGGTRSVVEFGNLPALGLTVKEAGEFVPFAAGEVAAGRGGVSFDPEATTTAGLGQQVAAPLSVEEQGLAPRTADEVERGIQGAIDYAEANPFEAGGAVVGSLAGSAAIMGGAAAVSSRAGLATRALIQPGEEALGFGGAAVTRRVAGPQTAQRLFPDNEPLIFSEEAAIRGARRAGGVASEGIRRVRADLELGGTDRGQLQLPRGRQRGETESEPRDDLGPELDPFDVSDTRLFDPTREFGDVEGVESFIDEPAGDLPQDIGPGIGPRGEAGGFRGGTVEENFEAFLEGERARAELAQESLLETRTELAVDQRPAFDLGFEPAVTQDIFAEVGGELRFGREVATETELAREPIFEFEVETGRELEFEQEAEQELDMEFETEQETEIETELENELEFEVEPFGDGPSIDLDGDTADFEVFGRGLITDFGTVGEALGVDAEADAPGIDSEAVLGGPATPSAFDPMPFEGDQMLDLGAPTVTGLDGPGAMPPGGAFPASVANALFDERENQPLF